MIKRLALYCKMDGQEIYFNLRECHSSFIIGFIKVKRPEQGGILMSSSIFGVSGEFGPEPLKQLQQLNQFKKEAKLSYVDQEKVCRIALGCLCAGIGGLLLSYRMLPHRFFPLSKGRGSLISSALINIGLSLLLANHRFLKERMTLKTRFDCLNLVKQKRWQEALEMTYWLRNATIASRVKKVCSYYVQIQKEKENELFLLQQRLRKNENKKSFRLFFNKS